MCCFLSAGAVAADWWDVAPPFATGFWAVGRGFGRGTIIGVACGAFGGLVEGVFPLVLLGMSDGIKYGVPCGVFDGIAVGLCGGICCGTGKGIAPVPVKLGCAMGCTIIVAGTFP